MSETPLVLKKDLSKGSEILPLGTILVIEQGYSIPSYMQTAYHRNRGRTYKLFEGGEELPDTKRVNLGGNPTDTVITFLLPNEWTIVTTEFSGVIDSKDPIRKYIVLNQGGRAKKSGYSERRKKKLDKAGSIFVEAGSRNEPPSTIILNSR